MTTGRRRQRLLRRVRATLARIWLSPARRRWLRFTGRVRRRYSDGEAVVTFFHQMDDPHSHLAVQKLAAFRDRYAVRLAVHLVPAPETGYVDDPARWNAWARRDAADVAPYFGTHFPAGAGAPSPEAIARAQALAAGFLKAPDAPERLAELGERFWAGVPLPEPEPEAVTAAGRALRDGRLLRDVLGHYQGAMFHYEGEWYRGLDRLHLLEDRLWDENLLRRPESEAQEGPAAAADPHAPRAPGGRPRGERPWPPDRVCPLPPEDGSLPDRAAVRATARAVDLGITAFVSLRSPYSAIVLRRLRELASRTGARLDLRPVLPMVDRGVALPRRKALALLEDAAREARFRGVPFGRLLDPRGEPVRLTLSYFLFARAHGYGAAYLQSALDAIWSEGRDLARTGEVRRVLDRTGLSWEQARHHSASAAMEERLEANGKALEALGLWGVPTFVVSSAGAPDHATWGQDRLWRVAAEIAHRLREREPSL